MVHMKQFAKQESTSAGIGFLAESQFTNLLGLLNEARRFKRQHHKSQVVIILALAGDHVVDIRAISWWIPEDGPA